MEYQLAFSNRKTISISVKNGVLLVKAPFGTPRSTMDKVCEKHRKWILNRLEKSRAELQKPPLSAAEIKTLKEEAKLYFSETSRHFSKIMGLKFGRIKITSAKTRFGSCSSSRNICFSYLLMLFPEEAREYVVVHELAHIKEMNHSKKFYDIIERYMPDYKLRKRMLK